MFTEDEIRFIRNPNTHVDFLIYNDIQKIPILAIEVDGFKYHMESSVQYERDRKKDYIFKKCEIPLIRLLTIGSCEIEIIRDVLIQTYLT